MKVVCIAGRYRGPTAWAVEENIRAATRVAADVWSSGLAALCPHANSAHMEGVAPDEVFLRGTLEMMRRCDAVLLIPGWMTSAGAVAEAREADALGIPIFETDGERATTLKWCEVIAGMEPGFRLPHVQGYESMFAVGNERKA